LLFGVFGVLGVVGSLLIVVEAEEEVTAATFIARMISRCYRVFL
jgi:hypothetical protein